MKIKLTLCTILMALGVFLAGGKPAEAAEVWQAAYWNNRSMWGTPVLTRNESGLDHNWGDSSPDEEIGTDNFSARWVTQTRFDSSGIYRFYATADDGMRVFVDGEELIDIWYESQEHIVNADIYLSEGIHNIKVEYFEGGGKATAKVRWVKVDSNVSTTGLWKAEYFDNINLSGTPVIVQTESNINYTWLTSPVAGIGDDFFSVRWSANVPVEAGIYRFTVRADDGIRLKVNDQLIIDKWRTQTPTTYSADVTLAAGNVPVVVEYFDQTANAVAILNWSKFSSSDVSQVENTATSLAITDWKGEYFDNTVLDGVPSVTRNDPGINFNWGSSSPIPNVLTHDFFSVRWSKSVDIPAGSYQFKVYALDGARVWVNGEQIIDHWELSTGDWLTGNFTSVGGANDVRVEYLHLGGMAEIFATWEPIGGATVVTTDEGETVITGPTATLKDARALTVRGGPGRDFSPVGYITTITTVKLLGRDSETYWIKVELPDGTIGWSSGKFLSSVTDFSTLTLVE